ncbi:hypothetical protein Tco_1569123 [Tanacetum coccineum]
MQELREETFSGNKNEDAHDHVDRVLNIVSLFNILGVSQDAVLLRVFPFTLTGTAKRWVDRLTLGAVNTWDLHVKGLYPKITILKTNTSYPSRRYGVYMRALTKDHIRLKSNTLYPEDSIRRI